MRIAVFIFLVMVLSGCVTKKPVVAEYAMSTKSMAIVKGTGCKEKSLRISSVFASSALNSTVMEYTDTKGAIYAFTESRWHEPLSMQVAQTLFQSSQDSSLFKSVVGSKSRSRSDLVLEVSIDRFFHKFLDESGGSVVEGAMSFSLIDVKTNMLVASKSFSSSAVPKTHNAIGGVGAYGAVMNDILEQERVWLGEVCR